MIQEKRRKIDFQDGCHGGHLGFLIRMILAIFDLQVTPMFPNKFRVNWPFGSGKANNRFSRWPPWWPSWISNQNNFSYFQSTSHSKASYPGWRIGLSVQEKMWKIDFQDCPMAAILDFGSERFYFFFDLQVTLMLPTKFRVSWPFSSGEKVKNYQDGSHGGHLGFPIGTILAIFDLQVTLILPTKFQVH